MKFPIFQLERSQTLYENTVRLNLTESGVHPCRLSDFLTTDELRMINDAPLGYGYTDGRPSLRRAIADWYPKAGPENVLVANGSSEANLLALTALLEPDDEIIVITPNFLQIDGLARALGVAVVNVALKREESWQPNLARVRAAITRKTKMISLCDPNNPTGVLMQQDVRQGLAQLARDHDLWLHVDEIYRGAEIDGGDAPTSYGLGSKVIVSGGLSKSFACPGLRLGWLVAPPEVVTLCHQRQDYTTIGTTMISQLAGELLMRPQTRDRILGRGRKIVAKGRDTIEAWVRSRNDWALVRPDSGGMAFLSYQANLGSEEFVKGLRESESVFVCAGSWFGIDRHIRVGIGIEHDHLEEGLAAIDRFVKA
jgi:aspartate/methionine/tyrosine aminotransferase